MAIVIFQLKFVYYRLSHTLAVKPITHIDTVNRVDYDESTVIMGGI